MEIQLDSPKVITIKQPETVNLTSVIVERVLDDVLNKKVIVWIKDIPHPVELGDLSGDNYDNPEWTNDMIVSSLQDFLNSL